MFPTSDSILKPQLICHVLEVQIIVGEHLGVTQCESTSSLAWLKPRQNLQQPQIGKCFLHLNHGQLEATGLLENNFPPPLATKSALFGAAQPRTAPGRRNTTRAGEKFGELLQQYGLTRQPGFGTNGCRHSDAFPWGGGHGTLRVTRTGEQAGKALRSQGHHYAGVM